MATTDTLELLHAATDRATIVTVPERRMFALDGLGDPAGAGYRHAIETLHAIADLLRAKLHVEDHVETRVGPIECAWWTHPEPPRDEVPARFADRATWHWQQMVEIPRQATDADTEAVLAHAREEGAIPDADLVRVIRFDEGLSAQILHAGPRDSEPDSVRRLFDAVYAAGLRPRGHLHEILVSDPLHAPVERRHSILRLPVKKA
jgi:hypothetical protein